MDLGPFELPRTLGHPKFFVTQREQGQVALLVKRDTSAVGRERPMEDFGRMHVPRHSTCRIRHGLHNDMQR